MHHQDHKNKLNRTKFVTIAQYFVRFYAKFITFKTDNPRKAKLLTLFINPIRSKMFWKALLFTVVTVGTNQVTPLVNFLDMYAISSYWPLQDFPIVLYILLHIGPKSVI